MTCGTRLPRSGMEAMANIKVAQYRIKRNGRGFWCPHSKQRAAGFRHTPCGRDGPAAWALAEEMNAKWQAYLRGEVPSPAQLGKVSPEQADDLIPYRRGSLRHGLPQYLTHQGGRHRQKR